MFDVLYIAGTLAFFALMLAYVKFCQGLAGRDEAEEPSRDA